MFSILPNSRFFGLTITNNSIFVSLLGSGRKILAVNEHKLDDSPWVKNGLKNKDELTKSITAALTHAKPKAIEASLAVCTLPESTVFTKVLHIPKLKKNELAQTIPYEVGEFLPIPVEEVIMDWTIDPTPHMTDDKPMINVFVVAVPKKLVEDLQEVLGNVGVKLLAVESQPFSIVRSVKHLLNEKTSTLVLSIDNESTTLIIANKSRIKYVSTLNFGADQIKTDFTLHIEQLAKEVDESIRYYHNRLGEDAHVDALLLVGEGAMAKSMPAELEKLTRLNCSIGYLPMNLPNSLPIHPRFNSVIGASFWEKGK